MKNRETLEKQRTPKRFYGIVLLMYLPVCIALALIHASPWGWIITACSFGLLMGMRLTKMWQGLRIPLCFALAFALALWGLNASRPEKNVSLMGQVGREIIRFVSSFPGDEGKELGEASIWRVPNGYSFEKATLPHSKLEILTPLKDPGEYGVLQLHGGAFVADITDVHRMFAHRYSLLTQNGTVATLQYRLWPDADYPAQQEDAYDAWIYLTETLGFAPKNLIIAGDSAGGNLALSLTLRLRDEGKPLPRALVCMSPWADLSNSGPSHIFNATRDPTFGVSPENYHGEPIGVDVDYARGEDLKNPFISPSFGNYKDFPPMLLQAAENEVLLSDSQKIYDNALENGVDCTFTIYGTLFHVFQASLDLMPESKAAWEEVSAFLAKSLETAPADSY